MKKLIALLLCLATLATLIVGCGTTTSDEPEATESRIGIKAPAGTTIKIGLPQNGLVKDYKNNAFTKWLEKESGYNLEFVMYENAQRDYLAQIATEVQMPDWEMPDMLWGIHLNLQGVEDYGNAGYIIDLAPYFNNPEYSAEWWANLDKIEDKQFVEYVGDKMYSDNGEHIYAFPYIEYCTYDMMRHSAYINQKWLDALDLPMPTNTEELYNTLVAFKNDDPNGNNKKDEIPLLGRVSNYGDVVSWIVNMFCYMEDARPLRVDENGKISGYYWSDEYRQALIFLNKLVKEGLLPDSIFSLGNNDLAAEINPVGDYETVGIWLGHPTILLTEGSTVVDRYVAMPQWGYAVMDIGAAYMCTTITKDCEYPDACWDLLMLMSSPEGAYRMRYGEKGVDWVEATPGTTSFTGEPAEINVINQTVYGSANSQTWNAVNATIGLANENERTELSDNISEWNRKKLELMGGCYKANWDRYKEQGGLPEGVIMPLIYTTDEEEECSSWRNNVRSWFATCRANFIKGTGDMGDPSNDAHWQKYIAGFKTAGYDDWMVVCQDVYDAMIREKAAEK